MLVLFTISIEKQQHFFLHFCTFDIFILSSINTSQLFLYLYKSIRLNAQLLIKAQESIQDTIKQKNMWLPLLYCICLFLSHSIEFKKEYCLDCLMLLEVTNSYLLMLNDGPYNKINE